MEKRVLAMAVAVIMLLSLMSGTVTAFAADEATDYSNQSHMLKVHGNKLVWEDDESVEVVLSGVNLPGGEWTGTPGSEKVDRNIKEAMDNWHCNVVRLAVGTKGWNGGYDYQSGNYNNYRNFIDKVIDEAEKRGKYVILDLHEYGIFDSTDLAFWKEAATIYANNPTVLFGILNEPTPASWDIWRDGDSSGKIGHQAIVEAIRDTGARNIIVAGGRNYAKNTSGIVNGYALIDRNSKGETNVGNGIMYDTHWYAWHGYTKEWNEQIGPTRMKHPMLMGEFGWDAGLNKSLGGKVFNPGDEQYHDKWFDHLENFFDDYETYDNYMNWTAYSFHPSSAPAMLQKTDVNGVGYGDEGYAFTPTDYHGVYIKEMLINRRGTLSMALNKPIVDQSSGRAQYASDASFAIDSDNSTYWRCNRTGNRYFTLDLGSLYRINRYIVRHGGTGDFANAADFQLFVSRDNVNWTLADSAVGADAPVTDRYIVPISGRYIKFNVSKMVGGGADAVVYDFFLMGGETDGLDSVEITPPASYEVNETIVAKNQKIDFVTGQTADDWTKKGYALYSDGMAEDNVSPVLDITGLYGDTQTFGCSGAGSFGNFRNFDGFRFKYSSTKDMDFQVSLHYRATGPEKFTNIIKLPNTNGAWETIYITPEQLMPSPSDTWVKTDMVSQYNMSYANYEPVVKLHFTGEHDFVDYTRFEYFEAIWYGEADYYLDYMNIKGSVSDGIIEVAKRWQNNSGVIDGLANIMGLYDSKGRLINIVCEEISLPANTRTPKYYIRMTMPTDVDLTDCYLKTYTWRDGEGCVPVCQPVKISATGNITYGD